MNFLSTSFYPGFITFISHAPNHKFHLSTYIFFILNYQNFYFLPNSHSIENNSSNSMDNPSGL